MALIIMNFYGLVNTCLGGNNSSSWVKALQASMQPVFSGVPQGSILGPLLFNIYLNDFVDHQLKTRVLMYADDTVIYCAGKDTEIIKNALTQDLAEYVARYFDENELVINLKKGKTEVMLFGTAERLSLQNHQLNVKYQGVPINNTDDYIYLGHTLDKNLTLRENFDAVYKKRCNRLQLLFKLRHHVNLDAAIKICQSMILPVVTYTGLLKLQFTKTQLNKFQSIECRAKNIINSGEHNPISSIVEILHRQSCTIVRKCLDNRVNTRNDGYLLKLPKVKLEFVKQSFYYSGAKIYNDLSIEIRRESDYDAFLKLLKLFK